MRRVPKGCGNDQGIDPLAFPPGALVAPPVQFTVVQSAPNSSFGVGRAG
jgi:hypothetical protein